MQHNKGMEIRWHNMKIKVQLSYKDQGSVNAESLAPAIQKILQTTNWF